MNDLLSAFGICEEDLKEEKKIAARSKKKTGKAKGANFALPISFCGGHLRKVFTDEKAAEWSEETLKNRIRGAFRELAGIYFKLAVLKVEVKEKGINTYIKPEIFYRECTDEKKLEIPLEVTAEGAPPLWVDTRLSLEEIRALWVQAHPEYEGCKFHYDEKQKLLIPFMESNTSKGKSYALPLQVGYLGIRESYQESDFNAAEVTEDEIRKRFSKRFPEFSDCEFAYNAGENLLFPLLQKSDVKKVESISLPVEVRSGGLKAWIQPEDVEGRSSATLDEIRRALEKEYPEYSKERTEMQYDNIKRFVVAILKGSRKGIAFSSLDPEWKHEVIEDAEKCRWRVETTPFGVFRCNMTKKDDLQFELTAPKLPRKLAEEIIRIFEGTPVYEHAVQVFFDRRTRMYEIYEPEQKASRSAVVFERNAKKEWEQTLVMDAHSHGAHPAFFSGIDDADEQGVRLYMVFGNMDRAKRSYALRAGMAGIFKDLSYEDVFER